MVLKNNLIIFSKNRACQLHLLLDSISVNCIGLFNNISVLYYHDTDEYGYGYVKLGKSYPNINSIKEIYFRDDLLRIIDLMYDYTTFLVDDVVFYGKILNNGILTLINDNTICFSLRLGLNCVYSHPANIYYKIGSYENNNDYVTFDYTQQENGDFKYPLSTDGHIFNSKLIKQLLSEINFCNPNTLESNLQSFLFTNKIPKLVKCFNQSKLVSVPVNLVNKTHSNRNGLEFSISELELNNRNLNGDFIDFN